MWQLPDETLDERRARIVQRLDLGSRALHERLERIVDLAADRFDAMVAISLLENGILRRRHTRGLEQWQCPEGTSLCRLALEHEEGLLINDLRASPLTSNLRPDQIPGGARSSMSQPLQVRGQLIGLLCILRTEPTQWRERDEKSLQHFAYLAQEELARSEIVSITEGLGRLFVGQGDILSVHRPDGTLEYISPESAQVLGLHPERLVGGDPFSIFHEKDRSRVREDYLAPVLAGQSIRDAEYRIKNSSGEFQWLSTGMDPLFDDRGQVSAIVCRSRDITDRKQKETLLAESLALLEKSQQIARLGHWKFIAETNAIEWSPVLYEIFGLDPGGGPPGLETFRRMVHPEDLALVTEAGRAARNHLPIDLVHRIIRPDGEIRFVHERGKGVVNDRGEYEIHGILQDITDLKDTEVLLRETQQRLQAILSAVDNSALVSVTDRRGVIVKANEKFCEVSGYSEEELIGQPHSIVNSESHNREFWKEMWRTIGQGKTWRAEVKNRAKDGNEYWVDTVINPIFDPTGKIESYFSIRYLITDKKEQEARLARSEYHLSEANSIAKVGRWELDLQTNNLEWTRAVFDLFEIDPTRFEPTYEGFLQTVHPDDREAVNAAYTNSLATRSPYEIQHRLLMPDGRIKWVMERCRTDYDEHGKPIRSIGIVQDITSIRETERELERTRSILQQTSEVAQIGGWELDLLEGRLYWSKITRQIHEVDANFQPTLDNALEFYLQGYDRETIVAAVEEAIIAGKPYDVELRIRTARGKEKWVRSIGKAEFMERGCLRLYGTFQDISDRKQAEQELQQARMLAETSNRAKSEFLSSMSHELRTPMNAILGFSQLLELNPSGTLTDDDLDSIHEISIAGKHLLELINEVLDLSRIESGAISLNLESVSMSSVFSEIESIADSLASPRKIDFQIIEPEAYRVVYADRVRLKQVLLNLISNAIKYDAPGGKVRVHCEAKDGFLHIHVKDDGPGIPTEKQHLLFRPFQRLGAESGSIQGTGIGLVITRKLIGLMGGTITVDSAPGKGSIFSITVPLQLDGSEDSQINPRQIRSGLPPLREATVLYIEDNPANLRLMEQLLRRYKELKLISAHTPGLGIELSLSNTIDLFLVDIRLPGMDGYELIHTLQEDPRYASTPFIALSANAMDSDVRKATESGFHDYLTKPIHLEELEAILQKYLST